jgi:hypothetical protein
MLAVVCLFAVTVAVTPISAAFESHSKVPGEWSKSHYRWSGSDTPTTTSTSAPAMATPAAPAAVPAGSVAVPPASVPAVSAAVAPAPVPAVSAAVTLSPGMSDPDLLGEPLALQQSQLADMKDNLHVGSIRVDANWEYVQYGGPTSFDWSQYDQLVGAIRSEGMSIDFIIDGCASWASTNGGLFAQPDSAVQFATWAADVAARYGSGGPTTYEIWNEPNSAQFWQPTPDPAAYTQDLIAAYQAIKQVQPDQMVISGGLAPEPDDGTNIDPVTFLQDMYADGAGGYFDAVGYHPYSYPALPDTGEQWSGWTQMSATTPSIRSVMDANGDSGKQVWLTEVGWPTDTTSMSGTDGLDAQVDEVQEILAFAQTTAWVGPIYWYTYQDDSSGQFGLVTSSGTPKPTYYALAAAS